MRLLLLLLALCVCSSRATTSVTLAELLCDTNITAYGVNIPDETANNPLITLTNQNIPIVFELTDPALAGQVFVTILADTASFTAYDWTKTQTGNTLTLDEVEESGAVLVDPGHLVTCANNLGCDGMELDGIALQKLFPKNATYVLFTCQLEYTSNGSVTLMSAFHMLGQTKPVLTREPRRAMGVQEAKMGLQASGDTILGVTPPIVTNISFPASGITPAVTPAAASSSSSWTTTDSIILGVVLGVFALLLLILCLCALSTHDKLYGDNPNKDASGREFGTAEGTSARYNAKHHPHHTGTTRAGYVTFRTHAMRVGGGGEHHGGGHAVVSV